jgi:Fe2+ transport system protein FeoA
MRCAAHLPRGARGLVAAVEGSEETIARLASVGIVPGAALRIVRTGSPMAVAVGDARLGLGRPWAEALQILSS